MRDAPPPRARTLLDVFREATERAPEQVIVHVHDGGAETTCTYAQLREQAERALAGYRSRPLSVGAPVILLVTRGDEFLPAFWGALLAGLVPVPLTPPSGASVRGGEIDRLAGIWRTLGEPLVVVDEGMEAVAAAMVEPLGLPHRGIVSLADLSRGAPDREWHVARADDLAFLQFSSGSTGSPKGVELLHRNVVANVAQLMAAVPTEPDRDVVVSWMPYSHDMGLVGMHLGPLAARIKQVKLDPLDFVKRPALWFEVAHRHRATILSTANFALGLALRKVDDAALRSWDLSCVRMIGNGAEPISPGICRAFNERFALAKLSPNALTAMYGLAEATVVFAVGAIDAPLRVHRLEREPLEREGRVVLATARAASTIEIVEIGPPVEHAEVRVVDDDDRPVPELQVGHLQMRGPNVTRGYFQRADATAALFAGDWLRTGDLGFLVDGRICITGRAKDLLIVRGRKYFAHDVEEVAAQVAGVRASRVCAVGWYDAAAGAERSALFLGSDGDPTARARLVAAVDRHVRATLGLAVDRVLAIDPDRFTKTTSGKLQRYRLREALVAGELGAVVAAPSPAPAPVARGDAPHDAPHDDALAVIAMACRFPGADSPEAFWRNLAAGVDSVREIPPDRWSLDGFYDATGKRPHGSTSKWGGFVDDHDAFDAEFFGIEPGEAAVMDPQQRLLLEVAHEALERGGYAGALRVGKRIGVFVGASGNDHQEEIGRRLGHPEALPSSTAVGSLRNMMAGRVAHTLDLVGPAMVVDTACSSTLVALHLARQAIASGDCDLALVAGSTLNLSPNPYRVLSRAGALSPTGRCHAFGEHADGFVPGEGVGVLLVESLGAARAAGDRVLGVVRGTAVNNDGRSIGPMAPRLAGQQAVLDAAYRDAGLDPRTVTYVEAHGTGTPIGDPIEIRALSHVFSRTLPSGEPAPRCGLGSVKANIGHLLGAAGAASLIKVLLCFEHRELVPSLHGDVPNPGIDFEGTSLDLVRARRPWSSPGPRRAGVSGFGFGGTNAHVVLEEAPGPRGSVRPAATPGAGASRTHHLVALSAQGEPALQRTAGALASQLRAHPESSIADVCSSLTLARDERPNRVALVATDGNVAALAEELEALATGAPPPRRDRPPLRGVVGKRARRPRLALVFAGQGAQYVGQGRELYEREPEFRAELEACAALVTAAGGPSILEACYGRDASAEALRETAIAQPLLVAFEIALARWIARFGVEPTAVVGHSVGELAAACIAGALSAEDAIGIACARGRLMDRLPVRGVMAAVFAPLDAVEAAVAPFAAEASVAAVNAPNQVVIAGSDEAIAAITGALERDGFASSPLAVSHAFHSPLMAPVRDALAPALQEIRAHAPRVPMLSTVDLTWRSELGGAYWLDHVERRVRFAEAIARLREDGFDTFLEVGPGANLAGPLRMCVGRSEQASIGSLLKRGDPDTQSIASALGALWVRGATLDLARLHDAGRRPRVAVPTYPFERVRRAMPALPGGARAVVTTDHPLLTGVRDVTLERAVVDAVVRGDDPLVADHRVFGSHVLPGAACWELVVGAAQHALGRPVAGLRAVTFRRAIDVEGGAARALSVHFERGAGLAFSLRDGDEVLALGDVELEPRTPPASLPRLDLAAIRARCPDVAAPDALYRRLHALGMEHGPAYQRIVSARVGGGESLTELSAPGAGVTGFTLHPALGDAAIQGIAAILLRAHPEKAALFVPFDLDALELHAPVVDACVAHVALRDDVALAGVAEVLRCDVTLASGEGEVLARMRGLALKRAKAFVRSGGASDDVTSWLHVPAWRALPAVEVRALDRAGRWVVLDDADGTIGAAVERALTKAGQSCVRIDPVAADDPRRALGDAWTAPLAGVLDLRGCERLGELGAASRALRTFQVSRALARDSARVAPPLWLCTTAAVVTGSVADAALVPEHAALFALARALGEEDSAVHAVDLGLAAESADVLAARLIRELSIEPAGARLGVHRGDERLEPAFRPLAPATTIDRPARVHLITGGAAGIGLEVARHLGRGGGAQLAIFGRAPAGERTAALDSLVALGATVHYWSLDVADAAAVDRAVSEAVAQFGAIDAVVHAAGTVSAELAERKTAAEVDATLAPKALGARNLVGALERAGQRVERFVVFSSLSSLVPRFAGGLADYAAANAWLDAFAAVERARTGRRFVALAWSAWRETGMGAAPAMTAMLERRGLRALDTVRALRAFDLALATDAPNVLVVDADRARFDVATGRELHAERAEKGSTRPRERRASSRPLAPATEIESKIRALVARATRLSEAEVGLDESLLSLGLESLTAVEVVKELEAQFGRRLPTTLLFEHPTIRATAAWIAEATRGAQTAPQRAQPAQAAPPAAADDGQPYPLSSTQRAIVVTQSLHPDVASYAFLRVALRGERSLPAMQRALDRVVARHPMLRTAILSTDAQRTLSTVPPFVLEAIDASAVAEEELRNRPFDLARPPLLRVALAARDDERFDLLFCAHHAIADAWSLGIAALDTVRAYAAVLAGADAPLAPLRSSFRACVEAGSGPSSADLAFWSRQLETPLRSPPLPFDGDRDAPAEGPLCAHPSRLDPETTTRLRARAAEHGVSAFVELLSIHARWLASLAGAPCDELTISVAHAHRDARIDDLGLIFGSFADTLPVRLKLVVDEPLAALAARVRASFAEVQAHAGVSTLDLARIAQRSGGPAGHLPSVSYARFPLPPPTTGSLRVESIGGSTATAATRLGLAAWELDDTLCFSWNFPSSHFHRETIERLARDHVAAIEQAVREPVRVVAAGSPVVGAAHLRFFARAASAPERLALFDGRRALTYGQVARAARRVGRTLAERGVVRGEAVAIELAPSIEAVVAILGTLAAGAAYVPIDPAYPEPRRRVMREQAGARAALTSADLADLGPSGDDAGLPEPVVPDADDVAYVLFTSGSTGTPKRVAIPHGALARFLDATQACFGLGPEDRCVQTASTCFDASVRQIFAPLAVGAALVPLDPDLVRSPAELLALLERERITVYGSVPSLFARVLAEGEARVRAGQPLSLRALRWIVLGGEPLLAAPLRRWWDLTGGSARVANVYGPTEATVNVTCHVIDARPGDDVLQLPIGTAIDGAEVSVVDEGGAPCAPGQLGEIVIGGGCVAPAFGPLYRTGDLARRRADGVLEFAGRRDRQVKVRGFRVELAEIEAALEAQPSVARAAVTYGRSEDDHERLVAWVEPSAIAPTIAELRAALADALPAHLVPHRVRIVERLPRTPSGKVDLAQLETMASAPGSRVAAPARNASEAMLCTLFAEVIRVEAVGPDDDFFTLGGDSILALELFARLRGQLPFSPRPAELYRHRTPATLARRLEVLAAARVAPPVAALDPAAKEAPLTPSQVGFWLGHRLFPERSANWCASLRLRGPLDVARFRRALQWLVARHVMLRTRFVSRGLDGPRQLALDPPPPLDVPLEDLRGLDVDERAAALEARWLEARALRFDLEAAPPIRMRLVRLADDDHAWLVAAHHIIGDGWSGRLFARELLQAYDRLADPGAPEPPPLRASFHDYARALAARRPVDESSRAHWKAVFAKPYRAPSVPRLGSDPRADAVSVARCALEGDVVQRAADEASRRATSLFALVLAGFGRWIASAAGAEDLVIGVANAAREPLVPDVERIFGPFATGLPIRVSIANDLATTLGRVDAAVVGALQHADLPPAELLALVPRGEVEGARAGAQFFFTYLDFDSLGALEGETLRVDGDASRAGSELTAPGTDFVLTAQRSSGGLQLRLEARAALLDEPATRAALDAIAQSITALATSRCEVRTRTTPHEADAVPVDAALISYLPPSSQVARWAGLDVRAVREAVRGLLFAGGAARWLERLETPLGSSATLLLPYFADELSPASAGAIGEAVVDAVARARALGARRVSLAGMLPSLTGYGSAIAGRVAALDGAPVLTTGHATTVVAVVRTIARALAATGRALPSTSAAWLGLGSIGASSLELALAVLPHPRSIVLCDLPAHHARLERLADRLRVDHGFNGSLRVDTRTAREAIGEAELIVAATSAPGVLDVASLAAGTLVVDDSFPPSFDAVAANDRMRSARDVLLVGGGLLDVGATRRTIYAPAVDERLVAKLARDHAHGGIAGCQLEPLLLAVEPALPPTVGLVEPAAARRFWEVAVARRIDAAQLHCGEHAIDGALLAALRARAPRR